MKILHLKPMLLLLLFTGMLFQACSVKKPEAPSWDTTWDLPLTSKQYSIEDLLAEIDSEEIEFDTLGNPYFSITQDVDTVSVDDNLPASNSISQSFKEILGDRDIDAPTIPQTSFGFSNLVDPNYLILGQVPIDTNFSQDEALSSFDSFEQARISQGTLRLELTNELGISIHSLTITLFNTDNLSSPLGVADFDTLYDDSTSVRLIDLADSLLKNELTLRVYGAIDSQGIAAPAGNLTINSSFPTGLSVSSARAKLPSTSDITLADTINLDLDAGNVIHEATIAQGTLSLPVINNTGLPITISLSIPNFESSGTPLSLSRSIVKNSSDTLLVDLTGKVLKPDTTNNPQTIRVSATASIDTDPDSLYDINSTDSIQVTANVSPITFSSVTGQIAPTTIDIETMGQKVELPEGFDQARLTQAELTMNLYNNSTTDVAVNLTLINYGSGGTASINTTIEGKALAASDPLATEIVLTSDDLSDLLDPAPDSIIFSGQAELNPLGEVVVITANDFFYGDVEIYSPMAFALDDTTEIDLDPSDIEIDTTDMPDFEETFVYGNIHAELTSRLPVGASVTLYLGVIEDASQDPNALVIGPLTLESAITDTITGYAVEAVISTFDDSLTSSDISIFDNETLYIEPVVRLLPTTTTGGYLRGSDYITVNSTARLKVRAGEHLWNNEDN